MFALSIVNLVAHAGANMDVASKEQNVPEPVPNETHALVYPPEDDGAEVGTGTTVADTVEPLLAHWLRVPEVPGW